MTSPRRLIGRVMLWFIRPVSPDLSDVAFAHASAELDALRAEAARERASAEAWFTHAKAWRDANARYRTGAPAVGGDAP